MNDDGFRRVKIIVINNMMLEGLLAGRLRCTNWPVDGFLRRIAFDIARDAWLAQLVSVRFPEVADHETFPEMDLLFEMNP